MYASFIITLKTVPVLTFPLASDGVVLKLLGQLSKMATNKTPAKMGEWFSYAAYDVIGEMTFSQSFGFVDKGEDIGGSIANMETMELGFVVLGTSGPELPTSPS